MNDTELPVFSAAEARLARALGAAGLPTQITWIDRPTTLILPPEIHLRPDRQHRLLAQRVYDAAAPRGLGIRLSYLCHLDVPTPTSCCFVWSPGDQAAAERAGVGPGLTLRTESAPRVAHAVQGETRWRYLKNKAGSFRQANLELFF